MSARRSRSAARRNRNAPTCVTQRAVLTRSANLAAKQSRGLDQTLAKARRRLAAQAGPHLSVRELLDQLAGIEETMLFYHDGGKGRPRAQRLLTESSPTPRNLADHSHIPQY